MRTAARTTPGLLLCLVLAAGCQMQTVLPRDGIAEQVGLLKAAPPTNDAFRFIVLGDSQFMNDAKFDEIIAQARSRRPALVIQIGDMIPTERTRNPEEIRDQWRHHLKQVRRLDAPFLPVAGNHDLSASPHAPGVWSEVWGPTYYSFDYGNCHFIVLNTEDGGEIRSTFSAEQTLWLMRDLAATKAEHIFVFFHKPWWEHGKPWEVYHELLRKHGVKAVFAGHRHVYDFKQRDGIDYITTLAVKTNESPKAGQLSHHVEVDVTGKTLAMRVIHKGRALPMDFADPVAVDASNDKWFHLDPISVGGTGPTEIAFDVKNPLPVPVTFRAWFSEQIRSAISLDGGSAEVGIGPGEQKRVTFGAGAIGKLESSSFRMDYSIQGTSKRGPFDVRAHRVVFLQPDLSSLNVARKLPGRVVLVGPDKNRAMDWLLTERIGLTEGTNYLRASSTEQLEKLWPMLKAGDTLVLGHLPFFFDAKLGQWYDRNKGRVRQFVAGGGRLIACIGLREASREMLADYGIRYRPHGERWREKMGGNNGILNLAAPLTDGLVGSRIVHHRAAVVEGSFEPADMTGFSVLGTDNLGAPVIAARKLGKGHVVLIGAKLNSHHHIRFDGNQQRVWPNLLLLDAATLKRGN